jgi:hypothetical protein
MSEQLNHLMPVESPPEVGREVVARPEISAAMLNIIAKAASDPAVDVVKMQALLDMQERLMSRQAEQEFNEAMARLQPKLPRISKKGDVKYPINKNDQDGPKKHAFYFARIEDIDDGIRPLLNEEGFSLSGDTVPQADGRIIVTTTLRHRGGHAKTVQIGPLPLDTSGGKNNVQALGSTYSYGYRYGQRALLNLVFEGDDDDGERAGMEFISAEQVKEVNDLIVETGSDFNQFCDTIGVRGLTEIQPAAFTVAMNLLRSRKAARAKRAKGPAE